MQLNSLLGCKRCEGYGVMQRIAKRGEEGVKIPIEAVSAN